MPRLLLVLGPSGVGKSTILRKICQLDGRFVYVQPLVTRALRVGEVDKVAVSSEEFQRLEEQGEFLFVNSVFGNLYGTPRTPILHAFEIGEFPTLDWPLDRLEEMRSKLTTFSVLLVPPSLEILRMRLGSDARDPDGRRMDAGESEMAALKVAMPRVDLVLESAEGEVDSLSGRIIAEYLNSVTGGSDVPAVPSDRGP